MSPPSEHVRLDAPDLSNYFKAKMYSQCSQQAVCRSFARRVHLRGSFAVLLAVHPTALHEKVGVSTRERRKLLEVCAQFLSDRRLHRLVEVVDAVEHNLVTNQVIDRRPFPAGHER